MQDVKFLRHNEFQRISYDGVLTRFGELQRDNINTLMFGLISEENVYTKGGTFQNPSTWNFELEQDGFFIQKKTVREVYTIAQQDLIALSVAAADPALDRYDLVQARYKKTAENTNTVDIIDGGSGIISQDTREVDFRSELEVEVVTGTPGAGISPGLSAAGSASITGTVDLSSPVDLSNDYNLKLDIDKTGTFVTVDVRGATPAATTLTEIKTAINAAGFGAVATDNGTNLIISSLTTGEDSYVNFLPPTSNDALNEILGLTESANYSFEFQGEIEYFKIGEVRVQGGSSALVADDLRGLDKKGLWTQDQNNITKLFDLKSLTTSSLGAVILTGESVDGTLVEKDCVRWNTSTNQWEKASFNDLPLGVITDVSAGEITLFGKKDGLTGLTDTVTYYMDSTGNLTTTQTFVKIGNSIETTSLVVDIDLSDTMEEVSNIETRLGKVETRVGANEGKILDLQIQTYYLSQRSFNSSLFTIETFFDNKQRGDLNALAAPVDVMDDTDFDNNWLKRNGIPDYKNAYARNASWKFMLEPTEEFDLTGVGQIAKNEISSWDSINNCHWLITSAGNDGIGEILKLSKNMSKGKVEVMSRYYLPAAGTDNFWCGIDGDGSKLFFVRNNVNINGSNNTVYSILINSDGTLGKSGFEVSNGEEIDIVNSISNFHNIGGAGDDVGKYNSVLVWDNDNIMVVANNGATSLNLIALLKSNLGAGSVNNKTGFEKFLDGSQTARKNFTKVGNYLWAKQNDTVDDTRFIYKFDSTSDIISDVVISHSGKWNAFLDVDNTTNGVGEGITISEDGHILEICSTSANGDFIAKRSLSEAKWAENQEKSKRIMDASTNPNNPQACMVEEAGEKWTADVSVAANAVDLYRFDPDGGKWSVRLTGADWTSLYDLATDGTTVWMVGSDGTNYEVYFGLLADLNTAIELANGGSGDYDATNTLDLTSWGTLASGIGAANTNVLWGIAYNSITDIVYVLNTTDQKIDTLSKDGTTWTQGAIDLPTAHTNWQGIASKDSDSLFVIERRNGEPIERRIYSISISKSTSVSWFVEHINNVPSSSDSDSWSRMDISGNSLFLTHITDLTIQSIAIVDDPDTLQVQTFLNSDNVLLSNEVRTTTPIEERYFAPEDFSDPRDISDKYYMAVGYGDGSGMSILHLDEFLSERSSSGLPRYTPSRIRKQDFTPGLANMLFGDTGNSINSININEDALYITGLISATGVNSAQIIDLKSGTSMLFRGNAAGSDKSGSIYNGSISQRNDSLDYSTNHNSELDLSNISSPSEMYYVYAKTFTKEDTSDYSFDNPKTFVMFCGKEGTDMLVVDWDENGNRTPVKVWNNVSGGSPNSNMGVYSSWISDEGRAYFGRSGSVVSNSIAQSPIPVWDIKENDLAQNILANINLNNVVFSISPNSRCWKTASGEWRTQLIVGTWDTSTTSGFDYGSYMIDVEKETVEIIVELDTSTVDNDDLIQCDSSEELSFALGVNNFSGTQVTGTVRVFKKLYFNLPHRQPGNWFSDDNWFDSDIINEISNPKFLPRRSNESGNSSLAIKYSKNTGMLITGDTFSGLQMYNMYQSRNECEYVTSELSLASNPSYYHYRKNAQLPSLIKHLAVLNNDGNIAYTNGASENWSGTGADERIINRDGVTEGYLDWSGITGKDLVGINFIKDDDSGGAKITVTDNTASSVLPDWNGVEIDLFYAEASVDDEYVCWITLPDTTHTYTVKVEHSGLNNSGANDWMRIKKFFTGEILNNASVESTLLTSHSDHGGESQSYALTEGQSLSLEKFQDFSSGAGQTEFTLSTTNRAYEFLALSLDNGITWLFPDSVQFVWGSNSPNFDDNIIDSDGYFTVKFFSGLSASDPVRILFVPKANKYAITEKLKQANDGGSFISFGESVKELDFAIELI
jgi:hypothetical protein